MKNYDDVRTCAVCGEPVKELRYLDTYIMCEYHYVDEVTDDGMTKRLMEDPCCNDH